MNTNKSYKHNRNSLLKTLFLLILPLGIFTIFLFVKGNDLVFANQINILHDLDIKKAFFLPNPIQERISFGPKLITVKRGNDTFRVLTTSTDILEVLKKNNVILGKDDSVYLNTQYLINGSIVKIIKTKSVISQIIEDIPFKKETVKNDNILEGTENILQSGENGTKKLVYLNTYEDGVLISSEFIEEVVLKKPVEEIREIGALTYSLEGIEIRGYDCGYWYSVVDSGPYTDEEKSWLKFIMHCESGCNAEANKSRYKGLFQWNPYWWGKQFDENIFDGHAQIKNTLAKYRAGESTRANQWPKCHAKYLREN